MLFFWKNTKYRFSQKSSFLWDLWSADDPSQKQPTTFHFLSSPLFLLVSAKKGKPFSHLLASILFSRCVASMLFILYICSRGALCFTDVQFQTSSVAAAGVRGAALLCSVKGYVSCCGCGGEMTSGVVLLLHRPYSSIRNQSFDSCQH